MNSIRFLSFATFAILVFIGFSCSEDFFEATPGDRITPENHYRTAIEIEVSYLGAFRLLQDVAPDLVITNGLLADLVDVTENSDIYLRGINKHEFNSSNPYLDASGLYKVIVQANEVLVNIDTNIQDADFTVFLYNLYRGDLIGLRSWAYFNLARIYGQAAYIPDNLATLPEGGSIIYLSREVMMDTLIQHLDSMVLATDYFHGKFSINKHALLGEIYLEKNDYQLASEYLYKACNVAGSGNYKVDSKYGNESWKNIFVNSEDKDNTVMTAVPFSRDDQQDNKIEQYTSFHLDYSLKPTAGIITLFESQITKRDEPGDLHRGVGISYDTLDGEYMINKYSLNESKDFSAAVILHRAADIHLLYAEALNRLGETENALLILNDGYRTLPYWRSSQGIRGRVYLKSVELGPGSVEYVENLIMDERSMELAFEGKRWTDLMRIARRRNSPTYLVDRVSVKFLNTDDYWPVRNRLMDEENWYLPVY